MAKFRVETEELKASAAQIETKAAEYQNQYSKLYQEISNLKVEYKGQASDAFNNKIEGYRSSFEELGTVVRAYVDYLKNTAMQYEAVESAIADTAGKLTSSY